MEFEDSKRYKQIVLRLRWLTIIITSYLILFGRGIASLELLPSLVILFYLFSNVCAYFLPESYFMKVLFFYVLLLFDTFMVSLGIYITSQFDTDFYLVYFLIILVASIARSFKLLMVNALVICGIYGWFLWTRGWHSKPLEEGILLRVPFLFIMNLFYGFLIQSYERRTRKIKEELSQVEEEAQRYRQIVESAHDAVVILDERKRIRFYNQRFLELTQYEPEELRGEEFGKIGEVEKLLGEGLNSASGAQVKEVEVLRKTGEKRRVEVSAAKIPLSSERVDTIIYLKDVTERKRLEESFIQSEKMRALGEMAAGIAHHLNNVLSAILGRAQLLQLLLRREGNGSFPGGSEGVERELKVIEEAARDGARTIKKIQEFSRPRAKGSLSVLIHMNELLRDTIELSRTRIKDESEEKGISIEVRIEERGDCWVLGDPEELREVFLNILFNSIDALPQGGIITIKCYKSEGYVVVEIRDNGVGIPSSVLHRIFEPFFTTKGLQRSGLGLSVSYGIIRRHRGEIEVESQEGGGSTFVIRLPSSKVEELPLREGRRAEGGWA
jgi:PAS domain S-box-containing protein